MLLRFCVLLIVSGLLWSSRSIPAEVQSGVELKPVRILLYSELQGAIYGWLEDPPVPASSQAVTYSYSANFTELDDAIVAVIAANEEGTPMPDDRHKAVSALVTVRPVDLPEMRGVQILSSEHIEIVDLPADFYLAWKARWSPPAGSPNTNAGSENGGLKRE